MIIRAHTFIYQPTSPNEYHFITLIYESSTYLRHTLMTFQRGRKELYYDSSNLTLMKRLVNRSLKSVVVSDRNQPDLLIWIQLKSYKVKVTSFIIFRGVSVWVRKLLSFKTGWQDQIFNGLKFSESFSDVWVIRV